MIADVDLDMAGRSLRGSLHMAGSGTGWGLAVESLDACSQCVSPQLMSKKGEVMQRATCRHGARNIQSLIREAI